MKTFAEYLGEPEGELIKGRVYLIKVSPSYEKNARPEALHVIVSNDKYNFYYSDYADFRRDWERI